MKDYWKTGVLAPLNHVTQPYLFSYDKMRLIQRAFYPELLDE